MVSHSGLSHGPSDSPTVFGKSVTFMKVGKTMLKMYVTLQNMFIAGIDRVKDGERGATATEYALLVGFLAIGLIAGVTIFRTALNAMFTALGGVIDTWR